MKFDGICLNMTPGMPGCTIPSELWLTGLPNSSLPVKDAALMSSSALAESTEIMVRTTLTLITSCGLVINTNLKVCLAAKFSG